MLAAEAMHEASKRKKKERIMQILAAVKVVPDDQDIVASADGSLDFSKARPVVSEYDLNVIEAAAQLAEKTDSVVKTISVGPTNIDDSKLKKNILARGVDELNFVLNDAYDGIDAFATAQLLAKAADELGFDLIMVGDGSADLYAKQVGVQLANKLGIPYICGVVSCESDGSVLTCRRMLENELEAIEVSLPAVISILPDAATPRICGMKDILAAGKKPMNVTASDDNPEVKIDVISCKAPEQVERKCEILDAGDEDAIETFVAALKAVL